MKLKLPVVVQIVIGCVILIGLFAMACGFNIVPKDPVTKALFDRIVDAMWLILSVPTIAAAIQREENAVTNISKENKDEKTDVSDSALPNS